MGIVWHVRYLNSPKGRPQTSPMDILGRYLNACIALCAVNDCMYILHVITKQYLKTAFEASGTQRLHVLLQMLAHHPDFPTRQEVAEMGQEAYQPFTRMLQFMLEPLILSVASRSDSEPPGGTPMLE